LASCSMAQKRSLARSSTAPHIFKPISVGYEMKTILLI
jgi:hypothetical protein